MPAATDTAASTPSQPTVAGDGREIPTFVTSPQGVFAGLQVLVLSTDNEVSSWLQTRITGWGGRCEIATTVTRACARLLTEQPDEGRYQLLILHTAPGIAPIAFAALLRQESSLRDLPMVLAAAHISQAERSAFVQGGFSAVLPLPADTPALFSLLHQVLNPPAAIPASPRVTRLAERFGTADQPQYSILVIEDNVTNRKVTERILTRAGFHVALATSGDEALDLLEQKLFDLIITDLQMPDMSGIEVIQLYRAMAPGNHTPTIMLTANATASAKALCEKAGISAYLTKPVQAQKLISTCQQLLSHHEAHRPSTSPVAPAPAKALVLNVATLEMIAEHAGNPAFLTELADTFLADCETLFVNLEIACNNRDWPAFRDLAHGLKGAASSIGADALAQAASGFGSTHQNHEEAYLRLGRMRQEWQLARDALMAYFQSHHASA
ncbi:MAG: response regulator [Gammaproteobacteria bacterium]